MEEIVVGETVKDEGYIHQYPASCKHSKSTEIMKKSIMTGCDEVNDNEETPTAFGSDSSSKDE